MIVVRSGLLFLRQMLLMKLIIAANMGQAVGVVALGRMDAKKGVLSFVSFSFHLFKGRV